MDKKIFSWVGIVLFSLALAFTGCDKKEDAVPPPPETTAPEGQSMEGTETPPATEGGETAPANPCAPSQAPAQ